MAPVSWDEAEGKHIDSAHRKKEKKRKKKVKKHNVFKKRRFLKRCLHCLELEDGACQPAGPYMCAELDSCSSDRHLKMSK